MQINYGTFWYLASPYTKYPGGTEAAHKAVCVEHARLLYAEVPTFCPIAHTHPTSLAGIIPLDEYQLWMRVDRPFVEAAVGIIVLRMEGWAESYGVTHELELFRAAGKPVVWMDPGVLPDEFVRRRE